MLTLPLHTNAEIITTKFPSKRWIPSPELFPPELSASFSILHIVSKNYLLFESPFK